MDNFLPEGYQPPVSGGGFMKLQDGVNLIRIMSSAIIGYEYWTRDNKPVRLKEMPKETPDEIKTGDDGEPSKIKHFWAFVVYNYATEAIEILQLTQVSIMKAIRDYAQDEDWGNPKGYDIKITRSGQKLDTEYIVSAKPAKELDKEVVKKFEAKKINLEALYEGKNPFEASKRDNRLDVSLDDIDEETEMVNEATK